MNTYTDKTTKFVERAKAIHGNQYDYGKVLYLTAKQKVLITCSLHGIFEISPDNHLRGKGCKVCGRKKANKEKILRAGAKFKKQSQCHPNHQGKNYGYEKFKYINAKTPSKIWCVNCKEYFWQCPDKHLHGHGCSNCQGGLVRTKKYFIKQARKIHPIENYGYEEANYINAITKLKIWCPKCEKYFWQTPNKHTSGRGCSNCYSSKGELAIEIFLNSHNICYVKQKKFNNCKNINSLPYDFGLYIEDKIIGLIEFQGRHHYDSIEKWGGEKNLQYIQSNDKIKKEYCKQNNIPLLEIPYWDFVKIPEILTKFTLAL